MYIQVRTIDGKSKSVINVSKLMTVPDVKKKIHEVLNIAPEEQRLFYRGKQLEDDYKIFDYDVKLNDVIQVMIKPVILNKEDTPNTSNDDANESNAKTSVKLEFDMDIIFAKPVEGCTSKYYKHGDLVDAVDPRFGAWFEARVVGFASTQQQDSTIEENLVYIVQFERLEDGDTRGVLWHNVRPRARNTIKLANVNVNNKVMVNYNIEYPHERGYWYDLEVTSVSKKTRPPKLFGTLIIGVNKAPMENQQIFLLDEIMKIESPNLIENRTDEDEEIISKKTESLRKIGIDCLHCRDNQDMKCRHCGCSVCRGKDDPAKILICDECDDAFHIWCLDPPLDDVPEGDDDWYCPECKNDENEIVQAGDKLKESKKKANLASNNSTCNRDWGKGMACVGRTKVCTIVGAEHFGAIPGIEVGTSWKYRVQVSEDGVHRPHVAGISGRTSTGGGAYSLVLSGGYEDDVDSGESFMYTGSGGRDLSGNKRTNRQSMDQTLTRFNLALAMNCNAEVNHIKGATAKDWQGGKPVRVVRNYKLAKHSKYAPEEGNRYDGLYKVVRYFPEVGKSGFKVWRYELRRDDTTPAPWTTKGKKRIQELGLTIKYPDGYLEAEAAKEAQNKKNDGEKTPTRKRKSEGSTSKKAGKRSPLKETSNSPSTKQLKLAPYKLDKDIATQIKEDAKNKKIWDTCKEVLKEGKSKFMEKVTDVFSCICCQELVYDPVTTDCAHNICKSCLKRSFRAEVYTCPLCRSMLGKDYEIIVNTTLADILIKLFPGYEVGR